MNGAIIELICASGFLLVSHFVMSHPLRAAMVKALGDTGFQIAYSLVSLGALVWIYFAFTSAPAGDLPGSGEVGWMIATALTLPAMVLFAGSMMGNPALPTPKAAEQARAEPKGVFKVTRHPMMWGFALWGISHIVLHWSLRTTITALAITLLALVGAKMQDRKKQVLMGEAWQSWECRTSYWPRWSALLSVGAVPWILGLVFFALFSWLHLPIADIAAGIWRWL